MSQPHAATLWIARHGQSAGNVASDQAEAAGLATIDVAERDADVPLSPLGETQARALGRWFAAQPSDAQPARLLISPYVRAHATAARVAEALGQRPEVTIDERLRERDLGAFDRLTRVGWQQRHPEQAEMRARLGRPVSGSVVPGWKTESKMVALGTAAMRGSPETGENFAG